jgi:AraC-like DNA-binding protein
VPWLGFAPPRPAHAKSEGAAVSELLETPDMSVAEHMLTRAYGTMRLSASGNPHVLRLAQVPLTPAARLDRIGFSVHLELSDAAPSGALLFGRLGSGLIRCGSDGGDRHYGPGQVYLAAQPDHSYSVTMEDAEAEMAVLDPALPAELAATAPARRPQPLRFTGYEAVTPAAARMWSVTYAYVRDTVLADPGTVAHPLVTGYAARLLAATALAVFPNNAMAEPTIEDRHDAHPATLRRAVAFIDEHAHEDISVADIAACAFVTIRAVELAFRRHMGMTPRQYLRQIRLDRAHHDLIAADPRHETVTAVSYRWGFRSASRFAAFYRQAYGVSPGRTLRS